MSPSQLATPPIFALLTQEKNKLSTNPCSTSSTIEGWVDSVVVSCLLYVLVQVAAPEIRYITIRLYTNNVKKKIPCTEQLTSKPSEKGRLSSPSNKNLIYINLYWYYIQDLTTTSAIPRVS